MNESLIQACASLSDDLLNNHLELDAVIAEASIENGWFTEAQVRHALQVIATDFLAEVKLKEWLSNYQIDSPSRMRSVGLVLAGNIPAVGFHDCLCGLFSPHNIQIKLSSKDSVLIPFLISQISDRLPSGLGDRVSYVDQLKNFDAVIATGGSQAVTTFSKYFQDVPHVLRGHRNSIAILDGSENESDIQALGEDVYSYFGLGCRNVSKIVVPSDFDLVKLLRVWDVQYKDIMDNHKYKNNYDYSFALTIMAQRLHIQGDTIVMIESSDLTSRLATLHYQYYEDDSDLSRILDQSGDGIQCVMVKNGSSFQKVETVPFGHGQRPGLSDYADGIDTMKFLLNL